MATINNKFRHRALSLFILVALFAASTLPALAQTRRTRRTPRMGKATRTVPNTSPAYYTIPANQVIRARVNEHLSSETARIGDRFTATTMIPIYSSGIEVIPAGSIITGRVTDVRRAERKGKVGWLGVSFVSLQLPNGTTRTINGSLTDLSSDNVTYDNEGQVKGGSSTKRNVVFIGGGATAGALIGAIAGGGKGAGIGAGVGAGLGVAGAFFSKGKEAIVKPGTEFGVILNRSVSLPASTVR